MLSPESCHEQLCVLHYTTKQIIDHDERTSMRSIINANTIEHIYCLYPLDIVFKV